MMHLDRGAWKAVSEKPFQNDFENANLVLKVSGSCGTPFGVSAFEKGFKMYLSVLIVVAPEQSGGDH